MGKGGRMTALLALYLAVVAIPAAVPLEPIRTTGTAYTCQDHPANAMFPCQTTRWGADPTTEGMACPPEWARMALFVPTRGLLTCDDTPRHSTLYGLPHVDIRVATHGEAVTWGIREIVVYRWELPRWGQERKGI